MTKFWMEDIKILFDNKKLLEIFPSKNYDLNRKLNAIVRLSFYYAIIVFFIKKDKNVLLIPIIVLGVTYFVNNRKGNKVIFTDLLEDYISESDKNTSFRIPTKDNPFMNINIKDYGTPTQTKAAPSYNNVGVQNRMDELYNDGLYRDFKDVFNRNTGERQFLTMPNTEVPNKQGDFAKWLYGKPPTCKEGNQVACLAGNGRISSAQGGPT